MSLTFDAAASKYASEWGACLLRVGGAYALVLPCGKRWCAFTTDGRQCYGSSPQAALAAASFRGNSPARFTCLLDLCEAYPLPEGDSCD